MTQVTDKRTWSDLSLNEQDEIFNRWKAGEAARALSLEYGLSEKAVSRQVDRHGWDRSQPPGMANPRTPSAANTKKKTTPHTKKSARGGDVKMSAQEADRSSLKSGNGTATRKQMADREAASAASRASLIPPPEAELEYPLVFSIREIFSLIGRKIRGWFARVTRIFGRR